MNCVKYYEKIKQSGGGKSKDFQIFGSKYNLS